MGFGEGAWTSFPFRAKGLSIKYPWLSCFFSFFLEEKRVDWARLGLVSETKTETRRNRYDHYYCKATTPSQKVVRPFY